MGDKFVGYRIRRRRRLGAYITCTLSLADTAHHTGSLTSFGNVALGSNASHPRAAFNFLRIR